MRKILVPVDGSDHALRAVSQALQRADAEVHLLNVQAPLDGNVRTFVDNESVQAYHREEGLAALATARALLAAAGRPDHHHIVVGHPADTICRFASEGRFDDIVMGTHGRTGLLQLVMGSVARDVSKASAANVMLVA